jgi:hypothetical protein
LTRRAPEATTPVPSRERCKRCCIVRWESCVHHSCRVAGNCAQLAVRTQSARRGDRDSDVAIPGR